MHTLTPDLVSTLTLSLDPAIVEIDDGQLLEICQRNRDLRIERTADLVSLDFSAYPDCASDLSSQGLLQKVAR